MSDSSRRFLRIGRTAFAVVCTCIGGAYAQASTSSCVQPLCVNRTDDDATAPVPGMLRYAARSAADRAVVTFDAALNGRVIELDRRSPGNHIRVERNLSIQGPGANLLTIDGGNATRIFFIADGTVRISGVTLANGRAKGGDGGAATGGAGGGGGAAGFGGAIFLNRGSLTLNGVVLSGNRSSGGNGGGGGSGYGAGRGGGGGGFGGSSLRRSAGGTGGDLESSGEAEGAGGVGGGGDSSAESGGEGGWGGGGGGGGFFVHTSGGRGGTGGPSGFAGGVGGAGAFLDSDEGTATAAGGGYGGSALGGAIFVHSGQLQLRDVTFLNNSSVGGLGVAGAPNGIAKGGAIFICSSSFCGPGHDGVAAVSGKMLFQSSAAADAGQDPTCSGRDDADVCGLYLVAPAANDTKR